MHKLALEKEAYTILEGSWPRPRQRQRQRMSPAHPRGSGVGRTAALISPD